MLLSIVAVGVALLLPIPFLKNPRSKRSLAILGVVVLGIAGLAFVLEEERSRAVNLITFAAMIGLFWLAGKFEAKD